MCRLMSKWGFHYKIRDESSVPDVSITVNNKAKEQKNS